MENELAIKLYKKTLALKGVELDNLQSLKFMQACEKAIVENPKLNFGNLLIASKIYLQLVLDSPNSVL